MKLLTRLRELRAQGLEAFASDFTHYDTDNEVDILGVGAVTKSDITRLFLEKDAELEVLPTL